MTQENRISYPDTTQSFGIVGLLILAMIVFSPVLLILQRFWHHDIATFVYYVCSTGSAFLLISAWRKKRNAGQNTSFDFSMESTTNIVLVAITIIALQLGITIPLVSLIPMPEWVQEMFSEFGDSVSLYTFLTIVIAAPVLEELIFRGIMLDGLLKNYSPLKSILLSGFLFGLVHLNPWQFVSAMFIGFFAGWVYYKSRNLALPIIIHMANNGFVFLSMTLAQGQEMTDTELIDSYGGGLSTFLAVTASAILIAALGIFILNRRLKVREAEVVESVQEEL